MKKKLIILLIATIVVISTGCKKEKVLNCYLVKKEEGIETKRILKSTFKGNEVINITVALSADLDEKFVSYKSMYMGLLKSLFTKYEDLNGIDIITTDKENNVTVTLKADLTKMNKESKEALDIVNVKGNYKVTKKDLEKDGYICK